MRLATVTAAVLPFLLSAFSLVITRAGLAAESVAPQSPHAPANPLVQPLSPEDLQAWLDGYMPFALQRADIAGAVIVIVKDGRVLLQKGYGYADVATRRPVDPDTSLFRPASVSKLFTWTAVMQQVELGRVNLDQDVNTYLDFNIPPFRGHPITMRNLMTHTAGFQESLKDLRLADSTAVPPLREFLKRQIPTRIFPPGQIPAYSNYGTSLAGYIVERVSGQSFDRYMDEHIFSPLEMHHSTFRQPLPADLRPGMSSGYKLGSEPAQPYEVGGLVPAAGLALTGADMAKFMIAQLQDGEYSGRILLQPGTAQMMHNTPLTLISPSLNRMTLGFYEMNRNGHRIIGHEGDTPLFHSALELFLDEHVGLFISLNSLGRDGGAYAVRSGLLDEFADRYFPGPSLQGGVPSDVAKAHGMKLAGHYDSSRREETTFASLLNLVLQVSVTADDQGQIVASPVAGLGGQPRPFVELAPYVWREVSGKGRLAAKVVNDQVLMWAEDEDSPYLVYLRTPKWRDATWLIPALVIALGSLMATTLSWPIRALIRRTYGIRNSQQISAVRSYRWTQIAGAGGVLVMVAWLATLGVMAATFYVSSNIDPWILFLHILSIVVFPSAAAVSCRHAWVTCTTQTGLRSALCRIWSVALAASCLTLLWVAIVFHLIGFNTDF